MPNVFLFQEPVPNQKGWTPNLSAAANYGAINYVFSKDDQPMRNLNYSFGKIVKALKDFNPEEDFLCWCNAGDVAAIYLIMPFLTKQGFSKVNALHWNKEGAYYLPIEIPLNPAA